MSTSFGRGLHAASGRAVNLSAYDRYLGRWSRLFVPAVLAAAEIVQGCRVLDVASGTGEAASMALSRYPITCGPLQDPRLTRCCRVVGLERTASRRLSYRVSIRGAHRDV